MTPEAQSYLIQAVEKILNDWHLVNKPEDIRRTIFDKLNKSRDEVMLKLLGFNKDYNSSWQLDHCNGRSGNSIAGEYLKQVQQAAIQDWLKEVALPVLSESTRTKLQANFRAEYERAFRTAVIEAAKRQALKDAQDVVDRMAKGFPIDEFLSLRTLLDPTPTES